MYLPQRAGKTTPEIQKSPNVRISSIVQWFYPFSHANSMQQTPQMHVNTSPTCFEGPREIMFRAPGNLRIGLGARARKIMFRCHMILHFRPDWGPKSMVFSFPVYFLLRGGQIWEVARPHRAISCMLHAQWWKHFFIGIDRSSQNLLKLNAKSTGIVGINTILRQMQRN